MIDRAVPYDSSPTLAAIRARRILRVGTTGDYRPFTFRRPSGQYEGADIDMAAELAGMLQVELELVPTVWGRLLDDFLAGKFDIAMGGVTVSPARAEKGFFSVPYLVDGKRPLARREFAERFTSVAAIDQPGVRVIANPGAANEAFARANFVRATVIIHSDNATVFDELVAGRADVMITDGLEVDHQAHLHPELVAVPVATPFTRLEKAYYFPRDAAMKGFIDDWLREAMETGRWRRTLDRAMHAAE